MNFFCTKPGYETLERKLSVNMMKEFAIEYTPTAWLTNSLASDAIDTVCVITDDYHVVLYSMFQNLG